MVTFARACPGRRDDTRGSSGRTASAPSRTQTRARRRRARARPTAARCCCCSAARAWLCTAISGESPRRPCSRTADTSTPPSAPVSPSRTAASGRRRRRTFRSSLLTLSAALRLPEQPNEVHDGCIALELGGAAACGGGGDEMVNGSTQPWPVGFISRLCAESFDSHCWNC
jgi:hypothetical protein